MAQKAAHPGAPAPPFDTARPRSSSVSDPTVSHPNHPIELTVVAPAHNEVDNVDALVEQVGAALTDAGVSFEFILVDDASTDGTPERGRLLQADRPWLRVISLGVPVVGGGNGQSCAFKVGFAAARGRLVGVLDADLQNDPAEFPRMLGLLAEHNADMVQGDRSAARRQGDSPIRQIGSVVGRLFRRMILGDSIRDTGCSLRIMKREIAIALPLEFKGMHRFIPVTARSMGFSVIETPVSHRARHAGEPKYGMGITKRALPGLIDCFAVRWMGKRRRSASSVSEVGAAPTSREHVVVRPHPSEPASQSSAPSGGRA